jgi:hypothetical protein
VGGGFDGGEQGRTGILPRHAQELAQGQRRLQLAAALEAAEVGLDLRHQAEQMLLLGEGRAIVTPALAPGRTMLGPEHVAVAWLGLAFMRGDLARPLGDDDAVLRLAHFEAAADERRRHRIVVGVKPDVALDVDEPLMEQVGLGDPAGQPPQGRVLGGEELARGSSEVPLGAGVDLITPGAGLAVGVRPVGEAPAGEKPALDKAEHPLDAARAIGVADGVGDEGEPEPLGKGGISGTGIMSGPVPLSTTTWVLSIRQR